MPPASLSRPYRSVVLILAASYTVLVIAVGVAGRRMIDEIRDVEAQARELYEHPFRANAACHEARLAASLIRSELLFVQMERVPTGLHLQLNVDELDHQLDANLDLVEQFYLGDLQQVHEARTLAGRWRERRMALMRLLDAGLYDEARLLTLAEVAPLHDAVMRRLDAISDFTGQKGAFFAEEARRKAADSVQRMWGLLALLVIGALLGAFGVTLVVVGQLKRRDRELAHERERIRLLGDNVPGLATVLLDANGRIESWNEGATRLHGYEAAEIIGQPVDRLYTPEQRAAGKSAQLLALAQANGFHEDLDWRVRKDGKRLFADVIICPLRDTAGATRGYVKITRDISERHHLEQDLIAARDHAEAANRAKSSFLANMSHEVRTPLNAIIGLTQLVLDSPLEPVQRDFLGKVQRSSRALLGVLNDLLDYSKIEAGHLEFEDIDMNVEDVLHQSADLFMASIEHKGLAIVIEVDPALPKRVSGDPLRLGQVLNNLIGNAVKFTDHGEIRLSVDLVAQQPAESSVELRFSVSDTGIGIAPDSVEHLFRAFAQADESVTRRFGGTGLGLAICRHLVSLMGGRIWVDSQPGRGSRFVFNAHFGTGNRADGQGAAAAGLIPAGTPDQAAGQPEPPSKAWRQAAGPIAGKHILLVEDNELSQTVALEFMQRAGLKVSCAGSGGEALLAVEHDRFDAVLMDLHMPDMDGFEVTRRIRTLPGNQSLPIIALTAAALQQDRASAHAAGMNAHLAKPIDPESLIELLIQWLVPRVPEPVESDCVDSTMAATPRRAEPVLATAVTDAIRIDRAGALARMGGDAKVLARLLDRFIESHADTGRLVGEALDAGDKTRAIELLHRLAGAAASLGLSDLGRVASRFEVRLHEPEAGDAADLLGDRSPPPGDVIAELRQQLAEHFRLARGLIEAELRSDPPRQPRLVLRANGELQEAADVDALLRRDADRAQASVASPADVARAKGTAVDQPSSEVYAGALPPGRAATPASAAAGTPAREPGRPVDSCHGSQRQASGDADLMLADPSDHRRSSARRLIGTLEAIQPLLRERDLVPRELLDGLEAHTEAWAITLDPRVGAGMPGSVADAADVIDALGLLAEQLDAYDYPQAEQALHEALGRMRTLNA